LNRIWAITFAMALGGCVTVGKPAHGQALYFGLVRVTAAAESGGKIERTTVIGVWADRTGAAGNSAGFGFRDSRIISLAPECRAVFVIRNEQERVQLLEAFGETLGGAEKLCTVTGG
jgi:hypothetical protein